jgi:nicotinate-nucleotide adenylyltransferase
MRIAVFGGTFDPPHFGHIKLAQFVVDNKLAERVLFVPAYVPPHKRDVAISSFEHRVAMLRLALGDNDKFIISMIEGKEMRSPSYSYDTMASLERYYPDDDLLVMIGYDSLVQLHTWYRAGELVRRWKLLTYPRDNGSIPDNFRMEDWWNEKECKILSESVIDAKILQISSTEIRNRLVKSEKTNTLIVNEVEQYIRAHKLYAISS